MEETRIRVGEVELSCLVAGPPSGKLVILLHGFPEFSHGWIRSIDVLAAKGYRVLVPDQRGYGRSDKPEGIASYAIDLLAGDIVGLIRSQGRAKAFVVGHDWGAAVAWWLAIRHPELVEKLVILNVPHPIVMQRALRSSPAQIKRSWYVFFFQIPRAPEWWASRDAFAVLCRSLKGSSRRGTFSQSDLELYKRAWAEPGALTAMIHWYRAALRVPPAPPSDPRVRVPTLILWGCKDKFLGEEMVDPSAALCDSVKVERIPEATHWVHHEFPERVNASLLAFFEGL